MLVLFLGDPPRELHGDGDDGTATVTGVTHYDEHRGNCGDVKSIHCSTVGVVTELAVW